MGWIMKIYVLVENKSNESYIGEHGLSLLIEINGTTVLFDTGQTGVFLNNAKKMNKDLSKLDYVVLSHGHYDHVGGLKRFIEGTKYNKTILVGKGFLNKKYKKENDEFIYNGITFDDDFYPFTFVDGYYKINEDISVHGNITNKNDFEEINPRFYLKNKNYENDLFLDEIFITIKTKKGLLLICGCSHVGVVNIIEEIEKRTNKKVFAFIGGTHLTNANMTRIEKTIDRFRQLDFIGACHCSGNSDILGIELKDKYIKIRSGDILKKDAKEEYIKLLKENKKKPDYKKEMYQAQTDKNYKDGDKN